MPLRKDIKKVLVIGSGPIVIGQAAEFDYAGTQACRALKEEGLNVVLINSNPATIMTDKAMADKIYIEPLTLDVVKRVILQEKPDSILPTLGGQTGLNLAMELAEEGFLQANDVKLLGTHPETIRNAEDRQAFKDTMDRINQPLIASDIANSVEHSLEIADQIGYPVIVRPAYTLGGTGGGFADNAEQLSEVAAIGIAASRVGQVLIEKNISGWKEIEYEVMRDGKGNAIAICSMENVDPVGIHTGDSIVVAPAQTMNEYECQMMRTAALRIIHELGIEGGCNVQFALNPESYEYAVIEVNPRLSRSSALASKATGYPIAKVASKIAIGYGLDEIPNTVTGKTFACFEPTIDYIVVKFPRFPFDKFVYGDRRLGTQMKATGEIMSLGDSFEAAMMKAARSAELGVDSMIMPKFTKLSDEELMKIIEVKSDERVFAIMEMLRRGMSVEKLNAISKIDFWFLNGFKNIVDMEKELQDAKELTKDLVCRAKSMDFPDSVIERLSGKKVGALHRAPTYKKVDTCAAEFEAETPYYYSTYAEECEARTSDHKKIIVFGSGPIRIGQGIEFDYCSVHSVWALRRLGYEAVIVNNNPETVSTDFDTSDRLYFEPLTPEDVQSIIDVEKPDGVIVQFGGQTAIKLTKFLKTTGIKVLGTPIESIDAAEDREKFDEILEQCGIARPAGDTVFTAEEAVKVANSLGYPVLVRPSYVLGGQGMQIAYDDNDIKEYMGIINRSKQDNPILVDKYMMGREIEVDAICDGEDILIPGIMEHLERAGVHSGDSISVYPSITLEQRHIDKIVDYTTRLSKALKILGLVNIQFVLYNDEIYVIEVNPRSSRTVPYISKVTGITMVDLATRCMLGEKLADMGFGTGLFPPSEHYAVKVPVFSFQKLRDVDTQLGPEMKSTGEVLGISKNYKEALFKGLVAAGFKIKHTGTVLFSVRDVDKQELVRIADRFAAMGFDIYATSGTANVLNHNMIAANVVRKVDEPTPNILTLLESGKIDYVISTCTHGRKPEEAGVRIRRCAVEHAVPCLTSIDTANALVSALESNISIDSCEFIDINTL